MPDNEDLIVQVLSTVDLRTHHLADLLPTLSADRRHLYIRQAPSIGVTTETIALRDGLVMATLHIHDHRQFPPTDRDCFFRRRGVGWWEHADAEDPEIQQERSLWQLTHQGGASF